MVTVNKVRNKRKITKTSSKPTYKIPGPDEKNVPPKEFLSYCTLLYGESAIGKTSLAAEIDGAVVFQYDPMRTNLRIRQILMEQMTIPQMNKKKVEVTPWQKTLGYMESAFDDSSVKAIVIDNVQKCYESCLNHFCYEAGINHPNDAKDYGATWKAIADEFESVLNAWRSVNKGLILISHGHFREVKPPFGDAYDRWEPNIPNKAFEYVKANCDYVFNYFKSEGRRCIMVRSDEDAFTKCSVDDHFMSPSGEPVKLIPAGPTPKTAWNNIQASFANKLEDADKPSSTPRKKKRKIGS